jgi:PAS domain-containing protein
MILLRQVASYLTIPIWMMDERGDLLYYNEPAERLLGISFDDAGPLHADQLNRVFNITDLEGNPLDDTHLPVLSALANRQPAHHRVRFHGLDGMSREVEISAIPVEGQGKRFLGVFATFWESST